MEIRRKEDETAANPLCTKWCVATVKSEPVAWEPLDPGSAAVHQAQPLALDQKEVLPDPETPRDYDIGNYVDCRHSISDEIKYKLLTQPWTPHPSYEFPVYKDSENTSRKFNYSWLINYPFVSYSEKCAGVFCRVCVLFAPIQVGGQKLSTLVSQPCKNWQKVTTKLKNHATKKFHEAACLEAQIFSECYEKTYKILIHTLDEERCAQVEENRKKLAPVIETVVFAGKNGLPLGGKDNGELDNNGQSKSESIFQSLLHLHCQAGDITLHEHLLNEPQNAIYSSETIQREIIEASNIIVRSKLVHEINESGFFAVFLDDETTVTSNVEQMSVCVRYVKEDPVTVCEVFLGFLPVYNLTGASLAKALLDFLRECSLDLTKLRGQGYDGATKVAGHVNSIQAHIKSDFPKAAYSHCASHALNLTIAKSCTIRGIETTLGILNEAIGYFEESAKQMKYLSDAINAMCPKSRHKRLQSVCVTRWVERHDSIMVFAELFDAVIAALEAMQTDGDKAVRNKANFYYKSVCDFEFIINLTVAEFLLGITLPLSKELQRVNADIVECFDQVKLAVEVLEGKRSNSNAEFAEIFNIAQSLAIKHDIEVKLPQLAARQQHRCNVPCDSVEDYFRINTYIPFLDFMIQELAQRFTSHSNTVTDLGILIPLFSCRYPSEKLSRVLEMYGEDLPDSGNMVLEEFQLWKLKWQGKEEKEVPSTAIDSLTDCDKGWFPNIHILLRILCTLPVSAAPEKRSFSALHRIKTWLHSAVDEERLNGLAMLYINSHIKITVSEVDFSGRVTSRNSLCSFMSSTVPNGPWDCSQLFHS
uniref:52 kDa repressor of the inhibitor of the protein kinase-like n=1 Tax=Crocodylus porosus TaxID=8502 RepID=A0A7M4E584_CROPO